MSWPFCITNCKVWVEATKCSGNMSTLRVFVHMDDLPDIPTTDPGGVFTFDGYCWEVDPEGDLVCLPQGDDIAIADPTGAYFEDCEECEGDPGEDVPGTIGTSIPNRPGGPGVGDGVGGGGDHGDPEDPPAGGYLLTVCGDHAPWWPDGLEVYLPENNQPDPDADRVWRLSWFCLKYTAATALTSPLPDGALFIVPGAGDADCISCTRGVAEQLCEGEDDDGDTRYTTLPDLPEDTVYYIRNGRCRYLDPDGFQELIPANAVLQNPVGEYEDCDGCGQGVPFVICPGQPGASSTAWWARAEWLDGLSGTIYQRIGPWCYSIDTEATPTEIPDDAKLQVPYEQCPDCATCLCGDCRGDEGYSSEVGYKSTPCGGQTGVAIENLWHLGDTPPAEDVHHRLDGVCYVIAGGQTARVIPHGARIHPVVDVQENCFQCIKDGGGDGGGGLPPGFPDPPPECWLELFECVGGAATNKWVRLNQLAAVFGVVPADNLVNKIVHLAAPDDGYYTLGNKTCQDIAPGPTVTGQVDGVFNACPVPPCNCNGAQGASSMSGTAVAPSSGSLCDDDSIVGPYTFSAYSENATTCTWTWGRAVGSLTYGIGIIYSKITGLWTGFVNGKVGANPTIQIYTAGDADISVACVDGNIAGFVDWQPMPTCAARDGGLSTVFG